VGKDKKFVARYKLLIARLFFEEKKNIEQKSKPILNWYLC